ncbi:YwiC-like family protein [Ornithinimicrobium sp. W1665]|uniref:YwiC-like family protein n=1 Tax=Ornithinimicrobium sp. W1665 TaxID=3416666 RepID=UPI003CF3923A
MSVRSSVAPTARKLPGPGAGHRGGRRRRRPGWVPNQHGAWAMLSAPLLVGTLASGPRWAHLLLAAFWFAGYLAFFAATLWLKSRRRPRHLAPVQVYVALATALGAALLLVEPTLVRWAPLFVVPLSVGMVASATRHERALIAGLATAAGSCLMTPVAYDLGPGERWTVAWILTGVLAGYFTGTVFYVKSAIRRRGSTVFLLLSVGYHLLLAVLALALLPHGARLPLGGLALVLAVRAAAVPRLGWSPARLGVGEIVATLAVVVLALTTLV